MNNNERLLGPKVFKLTQTLIYAGSFYVFYAWIGWWGIIPGILIGLILNYVLAFIWGGIAYHLKNDDNKS